MRRPAVLLLAAATVVLSAPALMTRTVDPKKPRIAVNPPPAPRQALALPDTFVLAQYDFEDGMGGPDAQGWISVDRTAQGEYFHVDDFAGAGPPYAPLSGAQSLWCGAETLLGCVNCPGYGNYWAQRFESVAFPATGNVHVNYLIKYDVEINYDFAYVEYLSKSNLWQTLTSYTGNGSELATLIVPADSLAGSVRVRFNFLSDGAFSDEDGYWPSNGAAIIDSLTLSDSMGLMDFQDFEAEVVGALSTADGHWSASTYPAFGDYAGLFDGSTVLQEDSFVVNNTHLWGFFDGSPDTYDCGGHPEQPAVPFTRVPGSSDAVDYIDNEVWSPWIDISEDENGTPIVSDLVGFLIEYDVYRDLPLDNLVFYKHRVRYVVDGDTTGWEGDTVFHAPTSIPDWYRMRADITDGYMPGATHIQVAVGCVDRCSDLCGIYGSGNCHSHAPLIDNVRVLRTAVAPMTVTNTNDDGPGSLRQAITDANDQAGIDEIRFDIPGPGPHVITLLSNLPWIEPTVLDATTQPGYSGTPLIVLDGGGQGAGLRGPVLKGDNSVVRGFEIRNFQYIGLTVSDIVGAVVEKNYIHHNGQMGVSVEGSAGSFNMIGGPTPDLGNIITDNGLDGIWKIHSGFGNSFLCNVIARNGGLGIDLQGSTSGVTPNDDQDPDTGSNRLQNFPVIRWADSGSSTIGASLNSTPDRTFTIQLFSNPSCDGSGYGEGENYLGSTQVSTGGDGNVEFAVTTDVAFADGDHITATATGSDGTSEFSECHEVTTPTGIHPEVATGPALHAAVPNPFNPTTEIRYDVPAPGAPVTIVVYDVSGRRIATLVDGYRTGGENRVTWNGRSDLGSEVSTGVYFYRMTTTGFTATRKMVLLK
jgi:hypothetical protein